MFYRGGVCSLIDDLPRLRFLKSAAEKSGFIICWNSELTAKGLRSGVLVGVIYFSSCFYISCTKTEDLRLDSSSCDFYATSGGGVNFGCSFYATTSLLNNCKAPLKNISSTRDSSLLYSGVILEVIFASAEISWTVSNLSCSNLSCKNDQGLSSMFSGSLIGFPASLTYCKPSSYFLNTFSSAVVMLSLGDN